MTPDLALIREVLGVQLRERALLGNALGVVAGVGALAIPCEARGAKSPGSPKAGARLRPSRTRGLKFPCADALGCWGLFLHNVWLCDGHGAQG
mmetsp:Transcript_16650/g.36796  ORF Transcript_16650/g.36796 Transcript_16650/m.36796 type:complete len:93 (-) Transcript_16650:81-359(-)